MSYTYTSKYKPGDILKFNRANDDRCGYFKDENFNQADTVSQVVMHITNDNVDIEYWFKNIDDGCAEKFILAKVGETNV